MEMQELIRVKHYEKHHGGMARTSPNPLWESAHFLYMSKAREASDAHLLVEEWPELGI